MESSLRVLLIEDDYLTATAMEESLIQHGYLICGKADSYDEAIKLMKQHLPDIVIVDIKLEGPADGITTVKELMRIKWTPVIYLTGKTEDKTFNRAKSTFPAAFLHKPFRIRELAAQIDLAMYNFYAGNIKGAPELPEHTFLPTTNGYVRVIKTEIQYAKADRSSTDLFLTTAGFQRLFPSKPYQAITISLNLGRLIPYLSSNFYQLSRSLVINLHYLDRIESNRLFIGSHEITLPEGARKALIERLQLVRTR